MALRYYMRMIKPRMNIEIKEKLNKKEKSQDMRVRVNNNDFNFF